MPPTRPNPAIIIAQVAGSGITPGASTNTVVSSGSSPGPTSILHRPNREMPPASRLNSLPSAAVPREIV